MCEKKKREEKARQRKKVEKGKKGLFSTINFICRATDNGLGLKGLCRKMLSLCRSS